MTMVLAGLAFAGVLAPQAEARGPEYSGPETVANGPAYFGPAPNPFPYCDSPTYFDPFPENVDPIGRMDIGDTASVTSGGITMDLVLTAEGNPDTQYPGFFPADGDGGASDQAKGIELGEGDGAAVTLSQPLFYSQWIFTDVDQPGEGFTITPVWTEVGEAAVFGGDEFWDFAGTTSDAVQLDDTNGAGSASEAIEGRVQVDFLGAVTGIDILRNFPSDGQSGFAVGGGCQATGAAKAVVDGPTWDGSGFEVTYELRIRNNLPSTDTITAVIADAEARAGASIVTGSPEGLILGDLELVDQLADDAFTDIEVLGLESPTGGLVVNDDYDGLDDDQLLSAGSAVAAETDELVVLTVRYTPDLTLPEWTDCPTGTYQYLNQSEVSGSAANVPFSDVSDDGTDASPAGNNGDGGVDDPTVVDFPCPGATLEIVKTVVPGPEGDCPDFDGGTPGDGEALPLSDGDTATYCISVRNGSDAVASDVVITDAQAPGPFEIGSLNPGDSETVSYDVDVTASTPTLNTASVTGNGPGGEPLGPISDTALISLDIPADPVLQVIKTVVEGPSGTCPSFDAGVDGPGTPLEIEVGDTVTYCISVRNIGAGDASNVTITDEQDPGGIVSVGPLGAGETFDHSYDVEITSTTPLTNTARVDGEGPGGDPLPPDEDDAELADPRGAAIDLTHTVIAPGGDCEDAVNGVDELILDAEDTPVQWCLRVENTGDVALTNVTVEAPAIGVDPTDVTPAVVLAPGEVVYLPVPGTIPDGGLDSPATVVGDPAEDDGTLITDLSEVTDNDDAGVREVAIQILKTVAAGTDADCANSGELAIVDVGDAVTWCFEVTNTGAETVIVTEVTDSVLGINVPIPSARQTLAAGESVTVKANGTATGDLTNVASVEGTPVDPNGDPFPGDPTVEDDDPAEIDTRSADLAIEKSVTPRAPVTAGDVLTYTLVVTNLGPDEAINVEVEDKIPGGLTYATLPEADGWACALGADMKSFLCSKATPLEADETVTLTYKAIVNAGADSGETLINTATVGSDTEDPDPTNNEDDTPTSIGFPPAPGPPEYPGPFTQPEPPAPVAPDEPDEVLGLAVTGASSRVLGMLSVAMLAMGGFFTVAARRSRRDEFG